MTYVSVYDFRNDLASYLDLVARTGARVVVKRFNKPVAVLAPYKKEEVNWEQFWGFMKARRDTGVAFESRVRRSTKERMWVKRYARAR